MGCTKVSPACDYCYAERDFDHRYGKVKWGAGNPRVRTSPANWKKPLQWDRAASAGFFRQCLVCGRREFRKWDKTLPPGGLSCCSNPGCVSLPETESTPARPRVFCASLADVFDNEVDPAWRSDLFALIDATPNLDWLLLTKRIGNVAKLTRGVSAWPNVWLGATVVTQEEVDRDVPKLLSTPACIRFLSIEPMLGPIVLPDCTGDHGCKFDGIDGHSDKPLGGVDWIIVGGESGPNARPMHPQWVRDIRDQCAASGVPFHFKQWGEWGPDLISPVHDSHRWAIEENEQSGGVWSYRVGKKAAGRTLDGIEHNGFPK